MPLHTSKILRSISSISFILMLPTTVVLGQSAGGRAPGSDFLSADKKGSASAERMFGRQVLPKDGFKEGWSGKGSAGLVASTGNAENTSINLGLSATLRKRPWRHTINSKIYFAENDGEQTAERYVISHKVNYSMGDRGYIFNFLSYDADEFANIDSRIADVIGYGRTLINNEKHNLEAELGVGFRQTQFTSDAPDTEETVGHIGLNYTGQLADTTTLTENLLIQGGSDNIFMESVTGLNVKMTEKLSLSLNYTVRNNSDVPDGKEKTDTVTSINVVSSF